MYLRLILLIFITAPCFGASVTKKLNKRRIVKIDEGADSGFTKGVRVCFYTANGRRAACGKVVKSKETLSYVRISKTKFFKRIKTGFEARLYQKSSNTGATNEVAGGGAHRNNVKIGYLFTAMSPTTYNNVLYDAPASTSATGLDSLWKKDIAVSGSLIGFYGEGEFAVGDTFAVAIGLRYVSNSATNAVSDYNLSVSSKFVESSQTGTALGFYSDFTFLDIAMTPSFFWRMSSGLDFDQSTVEFKADQKTDAGESTPIATYKSSITTASLRLGTNFNLLAIGPMGFILGANILVPLAEFGKSTTADVTDSQASQLSVGTEGANDDLANIIDHKKGSVGAQIYLSTYLSF